jgi:hypothetical protein
LVGERRRNTVGVSPGWHGFSDDIVIIVGSALVVSAAIGRSGLIETLMKPFIPRMTRKSHMA